MREGQREKKRLGRRKGEMRGGWDFIEARRDAVCALLKKVSGAAERKHTEDASKRRWWGATRGGQLRRRASGDRALKGPTPHAPSSCQLSFFFSLLLPLLLLSFSLSPSPSSLFLSVLVARMCLSSFSLPLSTRHFFLFLSPHVLSLSLILMNYTVSRVFSVSTFNLGCPFRPFFLPRPSSSSFPFRRRGRRRSASSYRHARSSRSEPRRRVSRFKLTRQRAP